ncbi:Abi family protein [Celeribacter persicus]|uniref:Abortive infection bacteriophage resistance protein n=1 Tax=Celeribacter persicus TaxID=1651082 RepID=A0A2T5GZF5_9RHOB|nr:Abi family protein [Celeribacter persicus]PTQ64640.1 abortive infection bacteriophage resistance protein [Celeribacter persicus]
MKFEKPAVSVPDQVELLKRRGMIVGDEAQAQHYLNFISYYRLRAYWLPFEVPAANNGDHAFRDGTTFENVLTLYIFDRELRLLVLDAIERVEVALRAQWAHHMAMSHGPHGYLEQGHYSVIRHHAKDVTDLEKEFNRSDDAFAIHYRDKYNSPKLPPVWMAAEVMSFGLLSKFYSNLKTRADRKAIADPFALDEAVVTSFAHHISTVRNICAHHGRLWNKRFTVTMTVPRYPAKLPVAMRDADLRYLHNTLVMLDYLLALIAPDNEWKQRLVALIDGCPLADPASMGFPADWRARAAWKV